MPDNPDLMYYAIMAVAAIVMVYSLNKHRTAAVPWGRPLAGFSGLVVVCVAMVILSRSFSTASNPVLKRFEAIQYAKMYSLGELLAKDYRGAKMILVRDFMPGAPDTGHEASMKAFNEGLKGACQIIGEHQTNPELMMGSDPDSATGGPDSMADFLDKAISDYETVDLVLVLSGYPINFVKLKYPEKLQGGVVPKVILAGGANHLGLPAAFDAGLVPLYIVDRRNLGQKFDEEEALPKEVKELFIKRFEVITPANYKTIAGQP